MSRVLHVMMKLPEKYGSAFQSFAHESLGRHTHCFMSLRTGRDAATHPATRPFEMLPRGAIGKFLALRRRMAEFAPEVVVFHGMNFLPAETAALLALFATSDVRYRAVWCIWGADVYKFQNPRPGARAMLSELLRRRLLRRVLYVSTLVAGDAEIARQHYSPRAELFNAFYPLPNVIDRPPVRRPATATEPFFVQVGNSASPNNEHDAVLERLATLSGNFRVLCPLAHGPARNAERVAALGTRLFGERFQAHRQMVPPDEYARLQSGVVVAIFNHNRQQGLGNILGLLHAGAKVYVRSDTTTGYFLGRLGLPLHDTRSLDEVRSIEELAAYEPDLPRVQQVIVERFSTRTATALWNDLIASVASRAPKARPGTRRHNPGNPAESA